MSDCSPPRVPIPGYEGYYEIDEMGNVYSLARKVTRVYKGTVHQMALAPKKMGIAYDSKGYPRLNLSKNGKARTFKLHRLVCRIFHGEPRPGLEVAHCNGDKKDPRAANLRWATPAENANDRRKHGTLLFGDRSPSSKLTNDEVLQIYARANRGEKLRHIARDFNVVTATVQSIKSGKTWSSVTGAKKSKQEKNHGG